MGIRLINKDADPDETPEEKKEINVYIGDSQRLEGQIITFNVGITDVLEHDLLVDIKTLLNGSAESEDFNAVTGQVRITNNPINKMSLKYNYSKTHNLFKRKIDTICLQYDNINNYLKISDSLDYRNNKREVV